MHEQIIIKTLNDRVKLLVDSLEVTKGLYQASEEKLKKVNELVQRAQLTTAEKAKTELLKEAISILNPKLKHPYENL